MPKAVMLLLKSNAVGSESQHYNQNKYIAQFWQKLIEQQLGPIRNCARIKWLRAAEQETKQVTPELSEERAWVRQ